MPSPKYYRLSWITVLLLLVLAVATGMILASSPWTVALAFVIFIPMAFVLGMCVASKKRDLEEQAMDGLMRDAMRAVEREDQGR